MEKIREQFSMSEQTEIEKKVKQYLVDCTKEGCPIVIPHIIEMVKQDFARELLKYYHNCCILDENNKSKSQAVSVKKIQELSGLKKE